MLAKRREIGWTRPESIDFSIVFALDILIGGRLFEVLVYEREIFFRQPALILEYWKGGMASHGVLLGGTVGMFLVCWLREKRFLQAADEVVVPAALLLAFGRIGNHINGEIFGSVTDGWWGVKFPYDEGYRHPVALYEGAKNLVVLAILLAVRTRVLPGTGLVLAHFVFWYGFLRIFVDLIRTYESYFLGVGKEQYFNVSMTMAGFALMMWLHRRPAPPAPVKGEPAFPTAWHPIRRLIFVALMVFALTIPSGWSQPWLAERRAAVEESVR